MFWPGALGVLGVLAVFWMEHNVDMQQGTGARAWAQAQAQAQGTAGAEASSGEARHGSEVQQREGIQRGYPGSQIFTFLVLDSCNIS